MSAGTDSELIVKAGSPPPSLAGIRCVMMDLDGTVYEGDTLYPTTLPFLNALTRHGIAWGFVTNNTSRSIDTYVARLRAMGIPISGPEPFIRQNVFYIFNRGCCCFITGRQDFFSKQF